MPVGSSKLTRFLSFGKENREEIFCFIFHPAYLRNVENFFLSRFVDGAGFPALLELAGFLKKIPDAVDLKESITSTTRTEESKKENETRRKHFCFLLRRFEFTFLHETASSSSHQTGWSLSDGTFRASTDRFSFSVSTAQCVPPFISECREQWIEQIYIHQQIT